MIDSLFPLLILAALAALVYSVLAAKPNKLFPVHKLKRTHARKMRDIAASIVGLAIANFIMAAAWYGHLKYMDSPIVLAIIISWSIALPEYVLHVSANRKAHAYLDISQLRVIQIILTLVTFTAFNWLIFDEALSMLDILGFVALFIGTAFIFSERKYEAPHGME
tara:strand:+ start:806 stop:1300 length:495 start_codon:yes stop_codon:yes gene_type:complete